MEVGWPMEAEWLPEVSWQAYERNWHKHDVRDVGTHGVRGRQLAGCVVGLREKAK